MQQYLVDTHVLIWYIAGSPRLADAYVQIIKNPENKVYVSKVSLWEIVIKVSIGKLKLEIEIEDINAYLKKNRIGELDFGQRELDQFLHLPQHHRDPFDRMIISQAICNNLTLITDDPKFKHYPVTILD